MEGTKLVTDTLDYESKSREVFCTGRSFFVKKSGPYRIKDPAESSNIAE